MNREPWESRVTALETENTRLRETVAPMEKDLSEVKSRNIDLEAVLKEKTEKLESLQKNYESLRKDASGFLELRKSFEKTRSNLARIEDELVEVTKENEIMRSSHRHRWFLVGALVLFCGLLIGLIMGRREKKRSSKLYL
jgi:SH3 domain protein